MTGYNDDLARLLRERFGDASDVERERPGSVPPSTPEQQAARRRVLNAALRPKGWGKRR